MKRIFALLIAALMVLSCFAALAEGQVDVTAPGAPFEGDTHWDTTFTGKKDGTLSVGGLLPGDTVKFYRVLEFDADASTKVADLKANSDVREGAGGWKVIAPFDTVISGTDLKDILSVGINDELAGKIAKKAVDVKDDEATTEVDETYNAKYTAKVKEEEGETVATVGSDEEPVEDGLYVAIVIPAKAGWMFNPIFVSSDYYSSKDADQSSTWTALTGQSYRNEAMAKKAPVEITKEAKENEEDTNETHGAKAVAVGDVIDFTVDTTIPEFADNYTAPLFIITDQLSDGLEFVDGSLTVYTVDGQTETKLTSGYTEAYPLDENDPNYDPNAKYPTYKITFTPEYIKGLSVATPIRVKYQAKVTEDAITNVNLEDNTVTLEYSHKPDADQEGEGKKIRDKTHHYSFTIDGMIWGDKEYHSTEIVKVKLDKDGNEVMSDKQELDNKYEIGALEGAEFKLYVDSECKTEYDKGAYAAATRTTAGNKILSDAKGRLYINGQKLAEGEDGADEDKHGICGLDAGTYYLKEELAPAGYIKQQAAVKIEIIPTYYDEFVFTETDEDGVTYKITCDDVLKSYIVEINGVQTAEYVLNYATPTEGVYPSDEPTKVTGTDVNTKGDIVIGNKGPITVEDPVVGADYGKVVNTQGVELPSTGGIGTTLFYIGGSILVLAAVILLVTKRRMGSED